MDSVNTTEPGKKEKIRRLFNGIATKYDLLNTLLSCGVDHYWRKAVISALKKGKHDTILDLATGTGDLAIAACKLNPKEVIGMDISENMVEIARKKVSKRKLDHIISFKIAGAESIPYPDCTFDAVIIGFGIRNFEKPELALQEIFRVLKENGVLIILEFSKPLYFPVKQFFGFYFNHVLPWVGYVFSKDRSAYKYLPESVKKFPCRGEFTSMMDNAAFSNSSFRDLSFGIAAIYTGEKRKL